MLQTVVVVLAALGASEPAGPLRLAVPELQVLNVDAKTASFYTEHLAQAMKLPEVSVVTTREIAAMLGLERQRQLLGCAEAAGSCLAELAGALGAEALVMGDVAKLDTATQLNLKVVGAASGATLATFSERASGEPAVLDALTRGARELLVKTFVALKRPVPPALLLARQPVAARLWWLPGVAGLALAGGGAALYAVAQGDYQVLRGATAQAPLSKEQASTALNRGRTLEPLGVGLLVAGGVGVATAAALLVVARVSAGADAPTATIVPLAQGGAVVVGGRFP